LEALADSIQPAQIMQLVLFLNIIFFMLFIYQLKEF
jgi:hypothetical protein